MSAEPLSPKKEREGLKCETSGTLDPMFSTKPKEVDNVHVWVKSRREAVAFLPVLPTPLKKIPSRTATS